MTEQELLAQASEHFSSLRNIAKELKQHDIELNLYHHTTYGGETTIPLVSYTGLSITKVLNQ